MAYTLNNSITYAQAFINGLNPTVYAGSEPAMTSANTVVSLMTNAPFTWPWNRSISTQLLTQGTQDYAISISNFGFLEKCTISIGAGSPPTTIVPTLVELDTVLNTRPLGLTSQSGRPNAVAVQYTSAGTSATFRFSPNPDQAYNATLIFQRTPTAFTATAQDWLTQCGIPYSYMDIFNPLFLSEMFQFSNDNERAVMYRQRGMAALLSKSEGLSQMQKSEILGQWMQDNLQTVAANLKTQQASQARAT